MNRSAAGRRSRHEALVAVAAVCLSVQVLSATLQDRSLVSPNASTWIAYSLVASGAYVVGDLRAYHLPGEPLYLAAHFALLPEGAWRYIHVPVVVAFATAVAFAGHVLGGRPLALASGLVASLDPYVVRHGPVWDDTLLAAAIEWILFAVIFATALAAANQDGTSRPVRLAAAGLLAGLAGLTRTHSQLIIAVAVLAFVLSRRLRPFRRVGLAMAIGLVASLGVWGARNQAVLGSFIVGSTRDGKALLESNCAYTRQGIRELGVVGGFMHDCAPVEVARALSLGEVDSDRALRRLAVTYITAHPVDVLATAAFKVPISLTGFDFASPPLSIRNVGAVSSSLLILTLGLIGLRKLAPGMMPPEVRQVLMVIAVTTAVVTVGMLAIGPVGLRYRMTLAGFLYLGAGTLIADRLLVKRAFDAGLAAAGLVLSAPLWVVIAAAIKIEDGGEVFYGQERVGQGGRRFDVLKFRSMVPDAEAKVGPMQATADDPRVTRVGRWLRATAMDELPQLWNILRGDMSFVGPRALRPGEIEVQGDGRVERLEDVPGFERRCAVRPGLTGIAQIYAPRDVPRRQKFRYDGVYLQHQTLTLDLRLIALSFWITFRGSWEARGRKF